MASTIANEKTIQMRHLFRIIVEVISTHVSPMSYTCNPSPGCLPGPPNTAVYYYVLSWFILSFNSLLFVMLTPYALLMLGMSITNPGM